MAKVPDRKLDALAQQNALGAFQDLHRGSSYHRNFALAMIAAGPGAALLALSYSLDPEASLWVLVLLPALGFCATVYGLIAIVRHAARRLQLHEDGLVYRELGSTVCLPYREMIGVTAVAVKYTDGVHVGQQTSATLRVQLKSGKPVTISDHFERLSLIVNALERGAAEPVLHNALERLRAGANVELGALTLTPNGLSAEGRTVPYEDLSIKCDQRHLTIAHKQQAFLRVRNHKVLNAAFLSKIVKAMRNERPHSAMSLGALAQHQHS